MGLKDNEQKKRLRNVVPSSACSYKHCNDRSLKACGECLCQSYLTLSIVSVELLSEMLWFEEL
jgi:hypothetical protein